MPPQKFVFSSELFQGFIVNIDVRDFNTIDEVIQVATTMLSSTLINNNLTLLAQRVFKAHWHIHHISLHDLVQNAPAIVYICEHVDAPQHENKIHNI